MKHLIQFEFKKINQVYSLVLSILIAIVAGIFLGGQFRMNLGEDIAVNGSYVWSYMAGMMSLGLVFVAAFFIHAIYFQEEEFHFSSILYSTPVQPWKLHFARYLTVMATSLLLFTLFLIALYTGQWLLQPEGVYHTFQISYGLYAWNSFAWTNVWISVTLISAIAWWTLDKKWVMPAAVLVYILYLSAMLLGKSPMFVNGSAESVGKLNWPALLDPFGLSAFFKNTSQWTVTQRNVEMLSWEQYFLANRITWLMAVTFIAFLALRRRLQRIYPKQQRSQTIAAINQSSPFVKTSIQALTNSIQFNWEYPIRCIYSLCRLQWNYLFYRWPFWILLGGLAFYHFMEWATSIDGSVRLPPRYASSGFLIDRAMQDFHFLSLIAVLFIGQDLVRRSQATGFQILQRSTPLPELTVAIANWLALCGVPLALFAMLLLSGGIFQWSFDYPFFQTKAYTGFFWLQMFSVCLSAGALVLLTGMLPAKPLFTWIAVIIVWLGSSDLWVQWSSNPMLWLLQPGKRIYSDFNGFDHYVNHAQFRGLTGATLLLLLYWLRWGKTVVQGKRALFLLGMGFLLSILLISIPSYLRGYQAQPDELQVQHAVTYEQKYRPFAFEPQPSIVHVQTSIDLFPDQRKYQVRGNYQIVNHHPTAIKNLLFNFPKEVVFENVIFNYLGKDYHLSGRDTMLVLQTPLAAGDRCNLQFNMKYSWYGSNSIHPFNAILENGSFMRISRFYPSLGYQSDLELTTRHLRVANGLDTNVTIKPVSENTDLINLDLTLSTSKEQTAIGTGQLKSQWKTTNRNYYHYVTPDRIPFRFAVSSAKYQMRAITHLGKTIELYYEPSHSENVPYLLSQAIQSLSQFEARWGAIPYSTIRFAEISAHSRGFAATAYPGSIFITEHMVFHAHLKTLKDSSSVAGISAHELSHLWWGTRGIHPAPVPGASVLTEGLAMYSEFLLTQKLLGNTGLNYLLESHHQLYLEGQKYEQETPLSTADEMHPFLTYSKAGLVLWQLHLRIGELKMQAALRQFYQKHSTPGNPATTADLIATLKMLAPKEYHEWINDQFTQIVQYEVIKASPKITRHGKEWKIELSWEGIKKIKEQQDQWHASPFQGPLTIGWRTADGNVHYENRFLKGNEKFISWTCSQQPVDIRIDPEYAYLWTKENSWTK